MRFLNATIGGFRETSSRASIPEASRVGLTEITVA